MTFRNVTFEMSLKPFRDVSEATMQDVCTGLFRQWQSLLSHTDQVSVLLWAADGSEILDYRGHLDDTFEWSRWQGVANPANPYRGDAPDEASIHHVPRLYTAAPPEFTYRWLRRLVDTLKRVGSQMTGLQVRVGATFDPGPEFALSDFKYRRHREVCMGDTMGQGTMVCCYATLAADERPYAGFPLGIPAGTAFGTFLGRQALHFSHDLGFDYLWLSNGFGFGLETWGLKGALFDGKCFSPERCQEVKHKSMVFWHAFRAECPDLPLETRGTNLSTGMDLSSDAVPWRDIYAEVPGLMPPPNSPWAALNGDFGLELVGWMSHIAHIPGDRFPFRFYSHDPWFLNSPWLDRYQRSAHDVYLPLSVARLDQSGRIQCPTELEFLTVDDSWGDMPDQVPDEIIPHILEARRWGPDAAGPLVWVYPFDEYHDMVFADVARLPEVFFGDWFMRGAVNRGLPLNTVVSTANATGLLQHHAGAVSGSVLVTPVPEAGTAWDETLAAWLSNGGRVLLYGPLDRARSFWREALGVCLGVPLAGDFAVLDPGTGVNDGQSHQLRHHALLSAGGMAETPGERFLPAGHVLGRQGDQERVLAARATVGTGGLLAWVRGTVSCDPGKMGGHLLVPYRAREAYPAESLMLWALTGFGWELQPQLSDPDSPVPLVCISRHANGFVFAGYSPDMTCALRLRTPLGAPLFSGWDVRVEEGRTRITPPRAWHRECRVFVDQTASTTVSCHIRHSGFPGVNRRLEITGLRQARVSFFPEPGTEQRVVATANAGVPCLGAPHVPLHVEGGPWGTHLVADGVDGQVMISW